VSPYGINLNFSVGILYQKKEAVGQEANSQDRKQKDVIPKDFIKSFVFLSTPLFESNDL
jgi:hypothetical protein